MKLKNVIIVLFLTSFLTGVVLYSCVRKKEEFIGPEYLSAPDGFTVSNLVASNNVNFTTSNAVLTADFSARVTYTITYRGLSSGAVKTFTGVDDKIDENSVGYNWNGSHDGINFFRSGEQVEVTISFLRSDYVVRDTITIATKKDFFSNPNYLPLVTGAANGYEATAAFPAQFAFLSGTCPTAGQFGAFDLMQAPEGLKYYKIGGKSCEANGFFIGGAQHRKSGFYFPNWTDPSQIYFNLYVYGSGNQNGRISLEFHEADLANDATKPKGECKPANTPGTPSIGKGEHDPCTDDAWVIQVPMDHVGWKLVSVKFSDMTPSVSVTNGGSGNKIKEPTRVHRIQMTVLSAPTPSEEINAYFDFPVLSYGAPFDPSK